MSVIEQTLAVILRCYVYKIPPAKTVQGHNAQDWSLDNPLNKTTALRLKVIEIDEKCFIRIEESDTGNLFLETAYSQQIDVSKVLDSSRYFVIRVVDPSRPNSHAWIGLGFQERDEAYEFENALRTHDKYAQRQQEIDKQKQEWAAHHQDLSLKSGQTIQVNIKVDANKSHQKRDPRIGGLAVPASAGSGLLTPPPGSSGQQASTTSSNSTSFNDWLAFGASNPSAINALPTTSNSMNAWATPSPNSQTASWRLTPTQGSTSTNSTVFDDWEDFTSSSASSKSQSNDSWATF